MIEKMDSERVYEELITVEMVYGEPHLELHRGMSIDNAIQKISTEDTVACFALSPERAIELAKELIDAAYYAKITRKKRPHKNGKRRKK